jgi:putative transposase
MQAVPKVAALLEEAEDDLLASYAFPLDPPGEAPIDEPPEQVNREMGRHSTDVVRIFPNNRSLIRLATSVVIEQNDT